MNEPTKKSLQEEVEAQCLVIKELSDEIDQLKGAVDRTNREKESFRKRMDDHSANASNYADRAKASDDQVKELLKYKYFAKELFKWLADGFVVGVSRERVMSMMHDQSLVLEYGKHGLFGE